jgi:FHA domain
MTVILQGSLRHFPPWQLLPFLACSVDLATLQVEGSMPARLWLRGGRAVWGESPAGNDVVSAAAAMLVADGAMFMVSDSIAVPDGVQTVEMEIGELLEEAGKRAQEIAVFGDHVKFRVIDDPSLHESISLTADEFRLVFKIGNGRSVGELMASATQSRDELTRALQNLQEHGLIARVDGGLSPDTAATRIEAAPPRPVTLPRTTQPKLLAGSLTADAPDGSVYPLIDDEYTIGREASNLIVLADGSVSAKHAVVTRTPQGWAILDLASRNGTFVNGEPVKDRRVLADNDIVRLGKIILTFNLAGEIRPADTTETPAV